jgi:hypothetical protein
LTPSGLVKVLGQLGGFPTARLSHYYGDWVGLDQILQALFVACNWQQCSWLVQCRDKGGGQIQLRGHCEIMLYVYIRKKERKLLLPIPNRQVAHHVHPRHWLELPSLVIIVPAACFISLLLPSLSLTCSLTWIQRQDVRGRKDGTFQIPSPVAMVAYFSPAVHAQQGHRGAQRQQPARRVADDCSPAKL